NQKIEPIVTASDENYAPYLNEMMTNVLKNKHAERSVIFYVIVCGLSLSSKKELQETVSSNSQNATVVFLTADKEVYQHFLVSDHITSTAYLRISLPSLL
ncbi:glycosyltransferase, partial [Enterococcus faecalis]|uniref:glycosyltransferase n=1 Tax=Enterococcus faecalis TaxID=1351 RepID=UPI003D6B5225